MFICCGWGYGSVIMPLPPHLLTKVLEVRKSSEILIHWGTGNEALVLWLRPTSALYIYKVIDNLHMLWMGIWIHHHAITTTVVGPDFGSIVKSKVAVLH